MYYWGTFSKDNKLRINYPEDERIKVFQLLIGELENNKFSYGTKGIYKIGLFKNKLVVSFEKYFSINTSSQAIEELLNNPQELFKLYEKDLRREYEVQVKEFRKKEQPSKIDNDFLEKKGFHYQTFLEHFLTKFILDDIKSGKFKLQRTVQIPEIRIIDEKYRSLGEDFATKFKQRFTGLEVRILN